ncbi:MAG TPA: hypothetical protein VGE18_02140 [Candidatus Paceibacterota bacterium]
MEILVERFYRFLALGFVLIICADIPENPLISCLIVLCALSAHMYAALLGMWIRRASITVRLTAIALALLWFAMVTTVRREKTPDEFQQMKTPVNLTGVFFIFTQYS